MSAKLPLGWEEAHLADAVEVLDRFRVPINSEERSSRQGSVPYYGSTRQVGWIDEFLFDEELVLLGEDGAPFMDSTKPKAYMIRGKSWVNNHAHVLRALPGMSSAFLMYQLNVLDYQGYVTGTTRLKLPQAPMLTLPVRVAPSAEQDRIVAEIEKQLTRLDAAVASLQRVRANLKRYRASVLQAAVEGRLESASGSASKWVMGTWTEALVRDIGRVQLGRQRSPKNRSNKHPTKYIRAANITWKGFALNDLLDMDFKPDELARYRLMPGDVLLAEASGSADQVGKPAIWQGAIPNCCFQNTVIRIRPHASVTPGFAHLVFYHYAINGTFSSVSSGVGIHHLSAERFGGLPFVYPPLVEQERIVAEVRRRLSVIEALELSVENGLKRAERLRQSVLKRAFEGNLVPQDPTDEPALVLMGRIRSERHLAAVKARRPMKKKQVQLSLSEAAGSS